MKLEHAPFKDFVLEEEGFFSNAREFVPHLTVGRAHSQEGLASALAALKAELASRPEGAGPLVFPVEAVHLFGEDPETGVYSRLATAPLGGAARGVGGQLRPGASQS